MKKCKLLALCMAAVLLLPSTASAKTINQLEQEQKDLKQKIETLNQEQTELSDYVATLDTELNSICEQYEVVSDEIVQVHTDIKDLKQEIKSQEKKVKNQEKALRKRIKNMYENNQHDIAETILLAGENLPILLNSNDFISLVSDYDETLLKNYVKAMEDLQNSQELLEQKKEEKIELKNELKIRKEEVNYLIQEKNNRIAEITEDIDYIYQEIEMNNDEIDSLKYEIIKAQQAVVKQNVLKNENVNNNPKPVVENKQETDAAILEIETPQIEQYYEEPVMETEPEYEEAYMPSSGFIYPCDGYVSSGYGPRNAPTEGASTWHLGLDFAAPWGSGIYAVQSGTVIVVSYHYARGNYIIIDHGNGLSTLYQHCSAIYASVGQQVRQGSVIAAVGSTGYSTGPHCHFEVLINGENVNPANYF